MDGDISPQDKISKIKQKLGWSPRVTFKQGMKELINK